MKRSSTQPGQAASHGHRGQRTRRRRFPAAAGHRPHHPVIALVLFLVGAGLGISIVVSALFGDRKARPREERGPR